MTGASCLLIAAACLTGCLVEGDREYDPPAPPQLFSGTHLSRVIADDPRLWLVLKKRLGAGSDRRCSADQRRNNTIIKTKDSLDAGAQFITAPSVTNYRDCEDECCREKTCNTAVVNLKESKKGQFEGIACYLFDCKSPSVCIFTSHPGFIVLEFDSKKFVDQHTDELDRLVSSSFNLSSAVTTTSITAPSTMTSVIEVGPKENGARKSFASLFSECHGSSDCRAENTVCLSGYCVCQQGFHVTEMQCRKDCDQELEFECANKNSPLFSECIAIYDYCDGIAQCTDGSDETSCGQRKGGGHARGRARSRGRLQPPAGINSSTWTVQTELVPVSSKIESSAAVISSSSTISPPDSTTSHSAVTKTGAIITPTTHRQSLVNRRTTTSAQDSGVELKQEKVQRSFWRTTETNRGAVVALALGIVLTTLLLVLAGCRLRHFRKRSRKGRHLNSNEADYLINGMYL